MTDAQANHQILRSVHSTLKREGVRRGFVKFLASEFAYTPDYVSKVIHNRIPVSRETSERA